MVARLIPLSISALGLIVATSCSTSDFAGGASRSKDKKEADEAATDEDDEAGDVDAGDEDGGSEAGDVDAGDAGTDADDGDGTDDGGIGGDSDFAGLPDLDISTSQGSVKAGRCSPDYSVPGTANIFLSGTPDGTSIAYNKGAPDRMPAQSPLLVVPDVQKCFKAGAKLYFEVSGTISHGSNPATNADGRMENVQSHQKGAHLGKSDIHAPLNALVGVFLGDGDPSANQPPSKLSYGTQDERDYATISPQLGQVFFIGDGKTSGGQYQKVVVPDGVTKLYLGIMDTYEWNNNSGQLTGAILVEK